ncbi:MAG: serine/threonine protein kinase [Gemmataceae bacterium]|uniref:non-specific serine/threonine protein kinase n=1 Tax=Thermogemmata fonticola TaxID=2755323 RepID=A0A7V8VCH3_9BACT|nr:serine/threonine-protein kinase [Thermogemmata fonticola]MBA2225431.1 serine/threonine protein kinase [Thermogemmata fonticola]MCX8139546.1 serine/threonine protein kinase [Gemmataceae bacterium]
MSEVASSTGSAASAVPPPDLTGRILGDYRLLRRLGYGGMGQVYLAEQLSLKREVALKLIRSDLQDTETARKRFQAEAEAVARLNHPNIVQIYQLGESDGFRFMVLEYVEGRNLRHYLERKGPPDLAICLSIIRQVALALQRAHEVGIVHRDIKPENILLTRKVEVKVADFGLSRFFAPEGPALHLTQSGVTLGTPLYMSPEQVQGQPVDHRSDIYSFGVTCFHLLAGEPPFQGKTAFDVALKHVQEEPPPLSAFRPDLPPDLCAMVHKMMAKRPEQRYQSVREILRDLNRIREQLHSGGGVHKAAAEMHLSFSGLRSESPSPSPSASHQTTVPFPAHPPLHRRSMWWLALLVGVLGAGFGAVIALAVHATRLRPGSSEEAAPPNVSNSTPNEDFRYLSPLVPRRERELLAILNKRGSKPDDVVAATLELVLLYVQQGRLQEAEERIQNLEREFVERPFPKGEKNSPLLRAVQSASRLAKAALQAYSPEVDAAQRSNEMFVKALEQAAIPPKSPKFDRLERGLAAVQMLLMRYPDLGELCHAALDRNAQALGVTILSPPVLEQLRQPPRLGRKD